MYFLSIPSGPWNAQTRPYFLTSQTKLALVFHYRCWREGQRETPYNAGGGLLFFTVQSWNQVFSLWFFNSFFLLFDRTVRECVFVRLFPFQNLMLPRQIGFPWRQDGKKAWWTKNRRKKKLYCWYIRFNSFCWNVHIKKSVPKKSPAKKNERTADVK